MIVQLATGSHYVSDIYSDSVLPQTDPSKTYGIHLGTDVPDEAMRLAPYGEAGRRRSLYGPDGVIRQSRRLEHLWSIGHRFEAPARSDFAALHRARSQGATDNHAEVW